MPRLSIALISLAVLLSGLFLLLSRPIAAQVGARITRFGEMHLMYAGNQDDGISPVCGCLATEDPAGFWRGIAFAGRRVAIERRSSAPLTAFLITAAYPEAIHWTPSTFEFEAEIFELGVPIEEVFDPQTVLNVKFPKAYSVISKRAVTTPVLTVITDAEVQVSLHGRLPIGAWIPSDRSSVSLRYEKGLFPNSELRAVLHESYVESRPVTYGGVVEDYYSLPMVDFLGPDVVLWTPSPNTVVTTGKEVLWGPLGRNKRGGIMAIVIRRPPFATRIALSPLDESGVSEHLSSLGSGAHRTTMGFRDSGEVTVSIIDPQKIAPNLQQALIGLKKNDKISVDDIPTTDQGRVSAEFRYPPIPPNEGFNIFGPLRNLRVSRADGSLVVGTREIRLQGSLLELSDIQVLSQKHGAIEVPIQTQRNTADLEIQVTSTAIVNGETVMTRLSVLGFLERYALLVAAIANAVLGFLAYFFRGGAHLH